MDPSEDQIAYATKTAMEVYEDTPETTCCHKAACCNAGCPNMYYSEFLSVRRGAVDKMTPEERLNLTLECVKRYLQDQRTPKPCVFLKKDNMCGIYEFRHLKCRLYGLIPDSLYDWIANSVADEMGVPREEVPLCNQCEFVKVKPEFQEKFPTGKVPEDDIKAMERRMRELDRGLGMSKETQDDGFGFLTYHDWHLLFEFGEKWMETLTQLRLKWTDEEKEKFVGDLKSALEKKLNQEKANG